MDIQTAYSTRRNITGIMNDFKNFFQGVTVKVLIYFASSNFDQVKLSQQMKIAFPDADVFGCSSAGELIGGNVLRNSVVAMVLSPAIIEDCKLEIINNSRVKSGIKKAFFSFEHHFGEKMSALAFDKYVGIVLMDGLSLAEEKIMEEIGVLTNVNFIGGSAGDDLKFEQTTVSANGATYSNSSVLALLKCKKRFDFIKTQSFRPLPQKMTATKVEADKRKVIEFDDQAAVEVYANALGINKKKAADYFMMNPLGLVVDEKVNDIYVRSPQKIQEDGIVFYCNIPEGMEVSLLESTDIIADTQKALANKIGELQGISGIINFNCILRTLELERKKQTEAYGELFREMPMIGFSTYGEAFLGHMNQTATMLVFGNSP
jgi:hypothetical protein